MTHVTTDHEILIVGAGFSGIGAAIEFNRTGLDDYLIVDEATDFGGTWFWNRYPGIAVDIPSFSYQFSFAQRPDWSRSFAPGDELRAYARDCAADAGLYDRVRFGTRVTAAAFDEDDHVWTVQTDGGDALTARYLVDASGVLTKPSTPDFPGLDTFAGDTVHTARWDATLELRDRRVAVVGTGASAIQVIPAIVEQVEHLTVFQRTPIWCVPRLDVPLPAPVQAALRHVPGAQRLTRAISEGLFELPVVGLHYDGRVHLVRAMESMARAWLRSQVPDPALRAKLTPDYAFGCKRPSTHNGYLRTFNRDDVTLETDGIAEIRPEGVVTASGTLHEADVLILATGFKVFGEDNFPKFPVTGRDGADLGRRWWHEGRFRSYEGVSVPDFPNYFTIFGPYGYNGSSYFNLVEAQSAHISRILRHARGRGATSVEVTEEATERFFADMMRRRVHQILWNESCTRANSYYFDDNGDAPLRPQSTRGVFRRARTYPLTDYRLEIPGRAGAVPPDGDRSAVARAALS